MRSISLPSRSTEAFATLVGREDQLVLEEALSRVRRQAGEGHLWHVSATARGGGVAELLSSLLPYALGAGIPAGWMVLEAEAGFFEITKRIHNLLHGRAVGGAGLGPDEREAYEAALRPEAEALASVMEAGDIAFLHDPQTAGLIPALARAGVRVLWRCHIGSDQPDEHVRSAWTFLLPYVEEADICIFSRAAHRWDGVKEDRTAVVPPCIDIVSPKNRPLDEEVVGAVLAVAGVVAPPTGPDPEALLRRHGMPDGLGARATMIEDEPIPAHARLVVQISRWDWLKDPIGVIDAFVDHAPQDEDLHLCLAGPQVDGVDDDPEGAEVLAQVRQRWASLPGPSRRRVHLAELAMDDLEANALIVNALQRRADIVVQKSLAEGFGLTVAEAMWKARPVVASRVGGIQDQIEHGRSGLLVDDPADLAACGRALSALLDDDAAAAVLAAAAHRRVCDRFLAGHLFAAEADALDALTVRA